MWKKAKLEDSFEPYWESPWGKGRPGWHIECSVMSINYLADTIDIHGGGYDLIFPHHENEIAQAQAATGKQFVRYWIHNGFVTINKEKMSKSLGNFFTLREIFEKFSSRVVRYFLLSQHYRNPLDFSDDKLNQAASALNGIDEAYIKLSGVSIPYRMPTQLSNLKSNVHEDLLSRFTSCLDDDFNTERALAVIHELKNDVLSSINQKEPNIIGKSLYTLKLMLEDYLGISAPQKLDIPGEVLEIQKEREKARKEKNWAKADVLRQKITDLGYNLQDNPNGSSTILKKKN